ncbi:MULTISPECIES: hypothetical protein [Metabacillus]|jgi:hypothetical protein|uniref:Uncharacterized protein n=3 Tax=Metabacillus TaxID=2675233 RepID=A0A179SPI8_9BACI|nr:MULTISPECIES: hypothetical protein [Metabacillus]OAS82849.1 hypothetical protein A6K24_12075 [Metabacillus litoralis]QNF30293.1 hypothetical protein HUW50_24195 [Metabacillus sp. KUDC1714]
MAIVYSVEVGDPINQVVMGNPKTYFDSIFDALSDGLYIVEGLEKRYGKEIVFLEKEPIIKGSKENSLHIWRGFLEGVAEPLYVQLNIEELDKEKELAIPNTPNTKLNDDQMLFITELETLLNRADEDDGLFYH